MGKLIYAFNVSLDGFIEGPDGKFDWAVPDPEVHRHFNELEKQIGTHLYGRRMWETMKVWQTLDQQPDAAPEEVEFARAWREAENLVFSRTLTSVDGNARLVRDDPVKMVAELKAQSGKDIDVGGAGLASIFIKAGLVDEYRLYFYPVLVGSGKQMFQGIEAPIRLKYLDTHPFVSGVTLVRYAPD
jgi:dihydrofolate reductase